MIFPLSLLYQVLFFPLYIAYVVLSVLKSCDVLFQLIFKTHVPNVRMPFQHFCLTLLLVLQINISKTEPIIVPPRHIHTHPFLLSFQCLLLKNLANIHSYPHQTSGSHPSCHQQPLFPQY